MNASLDSAEVARPVVLKPAVGGVRRRFVGTSLEWYDYFLYGSCAALVSPAVLRELGRPPARSSRWRRSPWRSAAPGRRVIFGHFGDRLGRKRMLIITLALMGVSTCSWGCCRRAQLGVWARPADRAAHGAGARTGRRVGGAALVAVENAPPASAALRRRHADGSAGGQLLASGLLGAFATLPDEQFYAWGWRVPFLFSAVLLAVGVYVRFGLAETPQFQRLERAAARQGAAGRAVPHLDQADDPAHVHPDRAEHRLLPVHRVLGGLCDQRAALPGAGADRVLIAAAEFVTMPGFAILSTGSAAAGLPVLGGVLALYAFRSSVGDTHQKVLIWVALAIGLGVGHSAACSLHGRCTPSTSHPGALHRRVVRLPGVQRDLGGAAAIVPPR